MVGYLMSKLIIEGLMPDEEIRWKKISCKCDHSDIEKCYPIFKSCIHCRCQHQEDLMPRESFKTSVSVKNEKTGKFKTITKTVTKIKINRGKIYHDIIGWYNLVEN